MSDFSACLVRGATHAPPALRPSVVTIGNFDGVHRGHQAMIERLLAEARMRDARSVVLTFEPTPQEFFAGSAAPARLLPAVDKYIELDRAGVDFHVVQRFGAALASMSPAQFVVDLLVGGLGAVAVVVGHDFRFGRKRRGDVRLLHEAGARLGFETCEIDAHFAGGVRVSSTKIRAALAAGNFARAELLLGRPYAMRGRVIAGERLGRTLGFPTANIRPRRRVLPIEGVFAVRVTDERGGLTLHPGVASLGTRPTVGGAGHLLEVHLFDFQGNLYGRRLRVDFVTRLRDEEKFPDVDTMTEQMHLDAAAARAALGAPE